MSALTEQVVRKQKDSRYYINVFLIILAAAGIPAVLASLAFIIDLPYMVYVSLFAGMFCIYGAWFFISSLKVDYEYAFLPYVMRIDKIIARRRRRLILKVDVRSFDDFFPFSDAEMSKRKFSKIYRAAAGEFDENNYVITFQSESKGRCAVIFSPNEEFLNAIKPCMNSDLRKKLFKENML